MATTYSMLGKRQRKEVDYSDALTEKQWVKALEDGNLEEMEETRRKRKKKRKDDNGEEPKKKKRSKGHLSMSNKLTRMMIKLWELLVGFQDDMGRRISDIFMILPTRRELPEYYHIIKKPIDLKKIKV